MYIWDTAGEVAYRGITRGFYKNAGAALIVYDIKNRSTFESIPEWIGEIK